MPGPRPSLTTSLLRADLRAKAFAIGRADRVGVEVELTPLAARDGRIDLRAAREGIDAMLADLGGRGGFAWRGGAVSREPGGQVEFSGPPAGRPEDAASATRWAVRRLRALARRRGVDLAPIGFHPWATTSGIGLRTAAPRYLAMQEYFDRIGPSGRRMMRLTGSVQVCVDFGAPAEAAERWELALRLSPVLAATFAHSPAEHGRPAPVASLRGETWLSLDPRRSGIPAMFLRDPESEPVDQYLDFALSAPVMFIRRRDGRHEVPDPSPTFRGWVDGGHEAGYPDIADWHVHLSTLFPDVRPQGYLELRAIDAPGNAWLDVPTLVAGHALRSPSIRGELLERLRPLHDRLDDLRRRAVAVGPVDAALSDLARHLFAAVRGILGPAEDARVAAFEERFVQAGRCPGDDLRDAIAPGELLDPSSLLRGDEVAMRRGGLNLARA